MKPPQRRAGWRVVIAVSVGLLALSCDPPPAPESAPPVVALSPAAHAVALQQALAQVPALWGADQREAAISVVGQAYAEQFTPIEPVLRAHDPAATLALEYAFGRLAGHLGRRGDAKALQAEVTALSDAVAAAVAALPPPPAAAPALDEQGNPIPVPTPINKSAEPLPVAAPAPKLPGR